MATQKSTRYVYYQPNVVNKKQPYDGDYTIRALSKALGVTWLEAFDMTIPICRRNQITDVLSAPAPIRNALMNELGFTYHGFSIRKGNRRPTVDGFAEAHPQGSFILNMAFGDEVACVDGMYYNTWDCGSKRVYGYFEKRDVSKNDIILRAAPVIEAEYEPGDKYESGDGGYAYGHIWEIRAFDTILFRIKSTSVIDGVPMFYIMQEDDGSLYAFSQDGPNANEIKAFMECINDMSPNDLASFLHSLKS